VPWFEVRTGANGFAASSTVEVIGNGVGMENTVYLGEFNTLGLAIEWNVGSAAAKPTVRPYWSFDGRLFFQKCFISESNAFTLPPDGQVITFPLGNASYIIELPAHAPFFRVGTTFNDPQALTASLAIRAAPRLR
jgi:hypothetical protein